MIVRITVPLIKYAAKQLSLSRFKIKFCCTANDLRVLIYSALPISRPYFNIRFRATLIFLSVSSAVRHFPDLHPCFLLRKNIIRSDPLSYITWYALISFAINSPETFASSCYFLKYVTFVCIALLYQLIHFLANNSLLRQDSTFLTSE